MKFEKEKLETLSYTRSQAVARIADRTASQHLWRSRDVIGHVTIRYHMSFPIGGPLERSLYLQPFSIYCDGVTSFLIKVTWRHRSRDHLIAHMPFPIGGLLEQGLYL